MKDRAIFERFIKAEISANEEWRIFDIFETEREKWRKELENLELKKVTLNHEIGELLRRASELQDANLRMENQLRDRESKLADCKIPALLDMALPNIEIIDENGDIKVAKPAREYYPRGYVARILEELEEFKEARDTKQKILELEFENAKMRVELRDLERDLENKQGDLT